MTAVIDKKMLKEALRELIIDEPSTFKNILKEIFIEEKKLTSDAEFERLINHNFERFGDTFRALA